MNHEMRNTSAKREEEIRAESDRLPRDLATAGYGEVYEHVRDLLAMLDQSREETEQWHRLAIGSEDARIREFVAQRDEARKALIEATERHIKTLAKAVADLEHTKIRAEAAERELEKFYEAAALVIGNARPLRPFEHARRAEGERRLAAAVKRRLAAALIRCVTKRG